ncbi:MAG: hypothetical protein K2M78_15555 [Lachnospiraceae bacterium]|nr:hypothetical protein [Lachnospiraceae bacterium]
MGINVRIKKAQKPNDIVIAQVRLEKDLKSCMQCRFFYGRNRQCIAKECVKEDKKFGMTVMRDIESECYGCPYGPSERYCFPCMKKLLGYKKKETCNGDKVEQEETEDG